VADSGTEITPVARQVMRLLSDLFGPWMVLLYAWWLGIRWTAIGLGAIYAIAVLLATGIAIGERRRGN